jgi:hypothetical protein
MKEAVLNFLQGKAASFALGLLYAFVYEYVYANYIMVVFDYGDSTRQHVVTDSIVWYYVLSAIPLIFFRGIKTFGAALSFFLYILAYIPIMNMLYVGNYPVSIRVSYAIALFVAMCAFFLTDHIFAFKTLLSRKRKQFPFRTLEIITTIMFIYLVIVQRGNIHFVNFIESAAEMYDFRAENNMGGNYVMAWLRSAFVPLLLVCYLHMKDYVKYAISFGTYIVLFMIDMQKITFIYPFVLTGLYFIATFREESFKRYFHVFLIAVMIVSALLLMTKLDNPVLSTIAFIFIFRTMCIEGLEMNTYLHFFEISHNPYTYYNHINIVDAITNANPYPESIGLAVTGGEGNANGVFWLMDGVAAAGVAGVIIISIVFIFVKAILNSLDRKCSVALCVCIMLNGIISMVNVSLFTALNSCGFIIIYLVFMFFDLSCLKEKSMFKAPKTIQNAKYKTI